MNKAESPNNTAPKEGTYWQGHGGVYAGVCRIGEHRYHIIFADTAESKFKAKWGKYSETIDGEFSFADGKHNTDLMLSDAENKITSSILNLNIDGHNDFYLPAQKELMLSYINAPEIFEKTWHWSSTQYSADRAWVQHFGDGGQYIGLKGSELAVRAVRRELVIE